MNEADGSAPAFPAQFFDERATGMTLRQYAAIKLKVPDSGEPWLDEMIKESLQADLAAHALASINNIKSAQDKANHAVEVADCLLGLKK